MTLGYYHYLEKELKKKRKKMSRVREMLDTEWTIVLFRNGRLGIVMKHEKSKGLRIFGYDEYGLAVSPAGITRVINYNEDLCFEPGDNDEINRKYDIMAIHDCRYHLPPSLTELKRILFGLQDPSEIVWDWKREEVKEVTMEDIEKAFGCKVKIVKEKENE